MYIEKQNQAVKVYFQSLTQSFYLRFKENTGDTY